mmetsp:Transcript_33479/g.92730  ORF Transcript_33479/g.92730 Transcript_33479/m.92730 type:complete len:98 (+) Transcript_33479:3-296(+)
MGGHSQSPTPSSKTMAGTPPGGSPRSSSMFSSWTPRIFGSRRAVLPNPSTKLDAIVPVGEAPAGQLQPKQHIRTMNPTFLARRKKAAESAAEGEPKA